jgi:hypothetical protein
MVTTSTGVSSRSTRPKSALAETVGAGPTGSHMSSMKAPASAGAFFVWCDQQLASNQAVMLSEASSRAS